MSANNKRALSSTASESEANSSLLDNSVFKDSEKTESKKKKKGKQDNKKQKTLDTFVEKMAEKGNSDSNPVERKLDEISRKLSDVLTKSDSSFIRDIIKNMLTDMKDQILSSITRRVEVLESQIFDKNSETDKLKKQLESKQSEIEKLKEENQDLRNKFDREILSSKMIANEQEQYSRKNNVRVQGVPEDEAKESSENCTKKTLQLLNAKMGLDIKDTDVGIAHRLGKFKDGKNRPVIVQFVRKQTKINIMSQTKKLKDTGIYINHDLTKLNNEVLASLRLKDKKRVEKCWFYEGKIFAAFKNELSPEMEPITRQILFKEYNYWLELPWPEKTSVIDTSLRSERDQ
jgi:regulator of replication initiation timing